MAHAAFLRSPYAHAVITRVDTAAARAMPGVLAVLDGAAMAALCTPWVGVLTHMRGLKSAPQHPLAIDRVRWQGEPVAIVVAKTRAQAEDAAEHIEADYDPLPPVVDVLAALEPGSPAIHPALGDNLAFERRIDAGRCRRCDGRRGCRGGSAVPVRPPHRGDARGARHRRRLERGRGAAHRPSGHPGAAHDADGVRPASGPRRTAGARRLPRCRRLLRHQDPRLRRRDGHRRRQPRCCAARSSSWPTGWRASSPTSTPATTWSRPASRSRRRRHHRLHRRRHDRHRAVSPPTRAPRRWRRTR